ncbi:hypothetical protein SALB1_3503 [Salinisphaera sp. LB1]|nr:hypothetical protein SALB1_3503 [Salinisphaera sp. LB1]
MHDINYRRAHTIVHWVYLEPLQIVAQYPDRFASDFMDMGKLDVHLNG